MSEKSQFLAFEPPHFGAGATLGGCVAAGLSGPRRASAGSVRDAMLGAKILDGRGQLLAFGGQVMKNVAGYDVSRLLAGSLGTLGLIVEVSLKLLPRPPAELTLKFEMPQAKALESLNRWAGQPLPISASAWRDGELALRLSGAASAVRAAAARLGGESRAGRRRPRVSGPVSASRRIRSSRATRRCGACRCRRSAPQVDLPGAQLLEWGGALRWLRAADARRGRRCVRRRRRARAAMRRCSAPREKPQGAFAPLPPVLARLHRDLKRAFDPAGILNPGRLYAEF